MGKRLDGASLLVIGGTLLFLSVMSTFFVFVSGFDWDPDDYPAAYWQAEIPRRQWTLAAGLAVPGLCALAAGLSMFALPRRPVRIIAGGMVAVLALGLFAVSWVFGFEAVDSARYWAVRQAGGFPG
ncbi:hypothetical protein ACFYLX_00960 [Pseudarthrobacter enclensis]|uniref:hypothetical protein n=1 Tax=Pseudarthrobacter enclensis TaxID=993070 RepID=UPI0036B6B57A